MCISILGQIGFGVRVSFGFVQHLWKGSIHHSHSTANFFLRLDHRVKICSCSTGLFGGFSKEEFVLVSYIF